jgi:hypothetical protein
LGTVPSGIWETISTLSISSGVKAAWICSRSFTLSTEKRFTRQPRSSDIGNSFRTRSRCLWAWAVVVCGKMPISSAKSLANFS